jgi:hypothetical protein
VAGHYRAAHRQQTMVDEIYRPEIERWIISELLTARRRRTPLRRPGPDRGASDPHDPDLARGPPTVPHALHPDLLRLAQPGLTLFRAPDRPMHTLRRPQKRPCTRTRHPHLDHPAEPRPRTLHLGQNRRRNPRTSRPLSATNQRLSTLGGPTTDRRSSVSVAGAAGAGGAAQAGAAGGGGAQWAAAPGQLGAGAEPPSGYAAGAARARTTHGSNLPPLGHRNASASGSGSGQIPVTVRVLDEASGSALGRPVDATARRCRKSQLTTWLRSAAVPRV